MFGGNNDFPRWDGESLESGVNTRKLLGLSDVYIDDYFVQSSEISTEMEKEEEERIVYEPLVVHALNDTYFNSRSGVCGSRSRPISKRSRIKSKKEQNKVAFDNKCKNLKGFSVFSPDFINLGELIGRNTMLYIQGDNIYIAATVDAVDILIRIYYNNIKEVVIIRPNDDSKSAKSNLKCDITISFLLSNIPQFEINKKKEGEESEPMKRTNEQIAKNLEEEAKMRKLLHINLIFHTFFHSVIHMFEYFVSQAVLFHYKNNASPCILSLDSHPDFNNESSSSSSSIVNLQNRKILIPLKYEELLRKKPALHSLSREKYLRCSNLMLMDDPEYPFEIFDCPQ